MYVRIIAPASIKVDTWEVKTLSLRNCVGRVARDCLFRGKKNEKIGKKFWIRERPLKHFCPSIDFRCFTFSILILVCVDVCFAIANPVFIMYLLLLPSPVNKFEVKMVVLCWFICHCYASFSEQDELEVSLFYCNLYGTSRNCLALWTCDVCRRNGNIYSNFTVV